MDAVAEYVAAAHLTLRRVAEHSNAAASSPAEVRAKALGELIGAQKRLLQAAAVPTWDAVLALLHDLRSGSAGRAQASALTAAEAGLHAVARAVSDAVAGLERDRAMAVGDGASPTAPSAAADATAATTELLGSGAEPGSALPLRPGTDSAMQRRRLSPGSTIPAFSATALPCEATVARRCPPHGPTPVPAEVPTLTVGQARPFHSSTLAGRPCLLVFLRHAG
jgi:hypothetical protein